MLNLFRGLTIEFDPNRDDGVTARQKSKMRWQAIEAFNSIHGLNPMARRLGVALICTMDGKTGQCFPSELGLATRLSVHLVSIKKAKAQLRELGLISWANPGGPRQVSHYVFNWDVLCRCAAAANKQAKEVVLENRLNRQKSNADAVNERWGVSKTPPVGSGSDDTIVVEAPETGSLNSNQDSVEASSKVAPRLPDITHGTAHLTKLPDAQHANSASETPSSFNSWPNATTAASKSGAGRAASFKHPCHFPQLLVGFKDEAEILVLIDGLSFDGLDQAAKTLAQQGKAAARKVILSQSRFESGFA